MNYIYYSNVCILLINFEKQLMISNNFYCYSKVKKVVNVNDLDYSVHGVIFEK
jgi:hypothetical protein